jgi:malate dehydrogenase (oxaloacetate-decarboxylating)
MFNDDMQGTGVVTLAALLAAIGSTNVPLENQRIVVFGAGTAGIGIADQLCQAMVRCGLDPEEAKKRFWLMDRPGLLLKNMSSISEFQAVYARDSADIQDWPKQDNLDLLTVVKAVRPTILVGCSTLRNAFTQEVIWEMAQQVARPIIFPLSNPTENCEATPLNILQWTQGRALIASGSPFEPVTLGNHTFEISQCNNALSFPGIGLGIIATHATQLTDNMLWAATQALSELAPVRNQPGAPLLPKLKDLKKIAFHIAQRVAQQACDEGVAQIVPTQSMADHINSTIWQPFYRPIRRASERFK